MINLIRKPKTFPPVVSNNEKEQPAETENKTALILPQSLSTNKPANKPTKPTNKPATKPTSEKKVNPHYLPFKAREFEPANFLDLAQIILNHSKIRVKHNKTGQITHYRIYELEFYLNNKLFQDLYTHSDPEQKQFAHWYFHRITPGGKYKGGTFKGLDLTLGHSDGYFGVLIRSVKKEITIDGSSLVDNGENKEITPVMQTEKINIAGPCNVVNRLLLDTGFGTIQELVETSKTTNVFENEFLQLEFIKENTYKSEIYSGPRIGLGISYPDLQQLPYRFTSHKKGYNLKKVNSLLLVRRPTDVSYERITTALQNNKEPF